jgi:tagatose 6-phosphate kinase
VITIVALNPALDVTHHVDGVDWAGVNRPAAASATPGGKGVNVARTLRALGAEALLLGLAGGSTGAAIESALGAAGVPAAFTRLAAETRRTFAVVDTRSSDVAIFNEPGPPVRPAEYREFLAAYAAVLPRSAAVVLSGSLPAGLPPDAYAGLIRMAAEAGVPAVLDTSGDPLTLGVAAGPAIVKPNLAELAATAGRELRWCAADGRAGRADEPGGPAGAAADRADVAAAAGKLRADGARAVVVSMSADGLLAVTGEGSWLAIPRPVAGNPTGAGDAVVAGLTYGLTLGWPWPERLRHAAALGSATAVAPVAGEFSASDYRQALDDVRVQTAGRD